MTERQTLTDEEIKTTLNQSPTATLEADPDSTDSDGTDGDTTDSTDGDSGTGDADGTDS
jgi:hypothetical protein